MQESERILKYRKSESQEAELRDLNQRLATVEEGLLRDAPVPQRATVFIIGAPRSGTTLLAQLLAASQGFGYVSNFTARFWCAPILAIKFEKLLDLHSPSSQTSFRSDLGRSEFLTGVHEFGYFWQRWFRFRETHKLSRQALARIDRDLLSKEIGGMEAVWQRPLFFKNLTCGLQIEFLAEVFPRALFVLNIRELFYNAQSVFTSRKSIYGNPATWFSLRPAQYPELLTKTAYEQIAGQIFFTLKDISEACNKLRERRSLIVKYEEVCANPKRAVRQIVDRANAFGARIKASQLEDIPERFSCTNTLKISADEISCLEKALASYDFGEYTQSTYQS